MLQYSPAGKGCRVPSFMVRPIHRVPRYKLLLESESFTIAVHAHGQLLIILFIEYIKYLPKDHPDLLNAKGKN